MLAIKEEINPEQEENKAIVFQGGYNLSIPGIEFKQNGKIGVLPDKLFSFLMQFVRET